MAVEVARASSERGELVLRRRRPDVDGQSAVWELRTNGIFVMDTVETSSEIALARAALAAVGSPERVLVGGLGLGFTMHAVLADPRVRVCDVVEIEPALVEWMRDGTIPHGPEFLDDGRAHVIVSDIADFVRQKPEPYDLILMDVDNGPGYLVHSANEALYQADFVTDVRRCLAPGGVVAFWAANRSPELLETLRRAWNQAEEIACPVSLQGRETHYWLYAAGD